MTEIEQKSSDLEQFYLFIYLSIYLFIYLVFICLLGQDLTM
jgi:hypothetical protein